MSYGYWPNPDPDQFQQVQGEWLPMNFYFNAQNQHYINLAPVENQHQYVVDPYNEFSQDMEVEEFFQSLKDNQCKLEDLIPEMENLAAELSIEQNLEMPNPEGMMDYNRPPPFLPIQGQIPVTSSNNHNEAPGIVNYHPTGPGIGGRGRKKKMSGVRTKLDRCTCPNCASGYNKQPGVKKIHLCHMPNCNKQYCTTSHLRAHLLTHDGIRPFGCNFPGCSKSFTRSDELVRHTRTHTGDRNYPCHICSKKFKRSDHLSKHVKVHSAEKKPRKPRGRAAGKVQVLQDLPLEQQQQLQHLVDVALRDDGFWAINS